MSVAYEHRQAAHCETGVVAIVSKWSDVCDLRGALAAERACGYGQNDDVAANSIAEPRTLLASHAEPPSNACSINGRSRRCSATPTKSELRMNKNAPYWRDRSIHG